MALKFKCSNCDSKIIVELLKPGESILCQNCSTTNTMPHNAVETFDDDLIALPKIEKQPHEITQLPNISDLSSNSFRAIFVKTFKIYRLGFLKFLCLSFFIQIPFMIGYLPIDLIETLLNAESNFDFTSIKLMELSHGFTLGYVVYFVIVYPILIGSNMLLTSQLILKRDVQLFNNVGRLNRKIGVIILGGLIIYLNVAFTTVGLIVFFTFTLLLVSQLVGTILLILSILLVIFLIISLALYFEVLLFENFGVIDSLRRCQELINGHRIRLLGYCIVFGLIFIVPTFFIVPHSVFVYPAIVDIFNILYYPISFIFPLLFYFDIRARKENYNTNDLTRDFDAFDRDDSENINSNDDPI